MSNVQDITITRHTKHLKTYTHHKKKKKAHRWQKKEEKTVIIIHDNMIKKYNFSKLIVRPTSILLMFEESYKLKGLLAELGARSAPAEHHG